MTSEQSDSVSKLFESVNARIVDCRLCPRLVEWRELVATEKRKSYAGQEYWGRGVPIFGDPRADKLIVGLAPAAHGANRTGRMFTGDRSGDWIYRALHKAGVANQPVSANKGDGLTLTSAMICAVAHCAPPDNKPTGEEILNCSRYLKEILASRRWRSILCLGGIAWQQTLRLLEVKTLHFGHGRAHRIPSGTLIVASYHPSQQNTFTGRLTEDMLDQAVNAWMAG